MIKKGERWKLIDASENADGSRNLLPNLTVGKTYTTTSDSEDRIKFFSDDGLKQSMFIRRFIKMKPIRNLPDWW